MIKLQITSADAVIEGESVVCSDSGIQKELASIAAEYGPENGDPEVWIANQAVRKLGATITEGHNPADEHVSPENPVEKNRVELVAEILKVDEDKQIVFGWASIVEEAGVPLVDRQNDVIPEEDMEVMAYNFVLNSRKAGEMHERIGVGKLIESIAFTKEKQEALGVNLGMIGWWVGFKIQDGDTWNKIKKGDLQAFSIHGKGVREKMED